MSVQRSNNENRTMPSPKKTATPTLDTSNRRVLGDVSPNLKKPASSAVSALRANQKPMTSSPLKRSFTAAMEAGEGFTYLKKRKLSDDEYLSNRSNSPETSHSQRGDSQFRPLLRDEKSIPEIHEPSPTEPNTPSSDDCDTQPSSQDRKSFSSLINYDPSSQTSNMVLNPVSNAEMLRLRLRVAMFKVRTNQMEVPFKDLQVEGTHQTGRSSKQEAVEEAVAQLRREAFEVQARDEARRGQRREGVPVLQAAPILKPTAYSSKMIYESGYPSSPPASRSPERSTKTPRHRRVVSLEAESGDECDGACEQELTSSVVKGRVAEGLLGLRHAI